MPISSSEYVETLRTVPNHATFLCGCFLLAVFVLAGTMLAGENQRYPDATAWNRPLLFGLPSADATGSNRYVAAAPGITACFLKDRVEFRIRNAAFRLQFLGANNEMELHGADPLPTRVNYLIGDQPQGWSVDLPTYGNVVYRGAYPGIDIQFGFEGKRLKSEFVVAPGADPAEIRFQYKGLGSAHIDQHGDLAFELDNGGFREAAPEGAEPSHGSRPARNDVEPR